MYKIEKTNYGVKLTFGGFMQSAELSKWVEDSENTLKTITSNSFGVLVDMRTLVPLSNDAQQEMQRGQVLYKQKGMIRSSVILANASIATQFKQIAQQTGIYQWERYFDDISNPNWEDSAIKWLTDGIDPDK